MGVPSSLVDEGNDIRLGIKPICLRNHCDTAMLTQSPGSVVAFFFDKSPLDFGSIDFPVTDFSDTKGITKNSYIGIPANFLNGLDNQWKHGNLFSKGTDSRILYVVC